MSKDKRGDVLPGIGGGLEFNPIPTKEKGEVKKKDTFRKSAHLSEQQLKYTYPKDQSRQLTLWETLEDETKEEIEVSGIEHSEIIEGIKLTPSETKIVDSLCKLLHQNSQNVEPENKNYYTGNKEPEIIAYKGENTPAPKLGFTLYELTKEYVGTDKKVAGKEIKNVANVLFRLSNKKFLIRYKEEINKRGGGKIVKELEIFQSIINLPTFREREYDKEGIEISKKEETIVILHPIFRRQIDSKFILSPTDINKRTIIAYGSHNISDITLRLREYFLNELSNKRYEPTITLDRLYYKLAEKWMRESRKAKVKEYTLKAIETMINLGLLESYNVETAKTTGELKAIFKLKKDFI